MNCQTCNNELIKNGSYCKNCKTIVNSENLPKTPVDKKSSWYSLEMLAFVFFSPKGRLNRTRYWGSLFLGGVVLGTILFSIPAVRDAILVLFLINGLLAFSVINIIMLLLFSMIYIKRIHDLNKSPLLLLLLPIPIIGLIVGLKLAFFKGTKGVNRYGFDPIK